MVWARLNQASWLVKEMHFCRSGVEKRIWQMLHQHDPAPNLINFHDFPPLWIHHSAASTGFRQTFMSPHQRNESPSTPQKCHQAENPYLGQMARFVSSKVNNFSLSTFLRAQAETGSRALDYKGSAAFAAKRAAFILPSSSPTSNTIRLQHTGGCRLPSQTRRG